MFSARIHMERIYFGTRISRYSNGHGEISHLRWDPRCRVSSQQWSFAKRKTQRILGHANSTLSTFKEERKNSDRTGDTALSRYCPYENYSRECTKRRKNASFSHEYTAHTELARLMPACARMYRWLSPGRSARFTVSCRIEEAPQVFRCSFVLQRIKSAPTVPRCLNSTLIWENKCWDLLH